jgi:hypothetical protein
MEYSEKLVREYKVHMLKTYNYEVNGGQAQLGLASLSRLYDAFSD